MANLDEAADAHFLRKRKEFLAAAGMLYAPVCTALSRHLLCDFTRISRAHEDTAICPKCNCLLVGGSSHVIIRRKPTLSQRIERLRRKSASQLTGIERRKLRRWENRKSKVVIYCRECKHTVFLPGPSTSASRDSHRKEAFARHSETPTSSGNRQRTQLQLYTNSSKKNRKKTRLDQTKKENDKLDVNPANRGKKERKLKHIKSMLQGNKKNTDSRSPLLKFLSSL